MHVFNGVCLLRFKDGNNLNEVLERLKKLKDAQKATVESCLEEIRHFLSL